MNIPKEEVEQRERVGWRQVTIFFSRTFRLFFSTKVPPTSTLTLEKLLLQFPITRSGIRRRVAPRHLLQPLPRPGRLSTYDIG